MRRLLLLTVAGLMALISAANTPGGYEAIYNDSLYRRAIKEGSSTLSCYLSYPQGGAQILQGYGNNAYELSRLDEFVRTVLSNPSIYVSSVRLSGHCSIDGSHATNDRLARSRVEGFRNFLNMQYRLSDYFHMDVRWVAEDWATLRTVVEASALYERNEILQIIDRVPDLDKREALLKQLNGGNAWQALTRDFFPLLRRVEIRVDYDLQRILEDKYQRKFTQSEFDQALERERAAVAAQEKQIVAEIKSEVTAAPVVVKEPVAVKVDKRAIREQQALERQRLLAEKRALKKVREDILPVVAIKTNIIPWAGITPEFERKTFMPNLAVEYFFAQQWSIEGAATYAYWNYDNDKQFWGVSGYSIEPRYWPLSSDGLYKWLYVGAFGILGDFDIQSSDISDPNYIPAYSVASYTGTYWQAGLSVGCYIPLTRNLGVEIGIRGGYENASAKVYEPDTDGNFWREDDPKTRFGVMGANVSVSWRFGK